MPELPEVETVARTLRPQVQECLIEGAEVLRSGSLHPLSLPLATLVGRRIADVGRRGKLLLVHLAPPESGRTPEETAPDLLAVHLRMTGRLMVYAPGTPPGFHTRCVFDLRTPDGDRRRLFFDDTRAFGLVLAATPDSLSHKLTS